MPAQTTPGLDSSQLYALCGQLEQVVLASFLPESLFRPINAAADPDRSADSIVSFGQMGAVFREAFAAAVERAGGVGLRGEICRWLERHGS